MINYVRKFLNNFLYFNDKTVLSRECEYFLWVKCSNYSLSILRSYFVKYVLITRHIPHLSSLYQYNTATSICSLNFIFDKLFGNLSLTYCKRVNNKSKESTFNKITSLLLLLLLLLLPLFTLF